MLKYATRVVHGLPEILRRQRLPQDADQYVTIGIIRTRDDDFIHMSTKHHIDIRCIALVPQPEHTRGRPELDQNRTPSIST